MTESLVSLMVGLAPISVCGQMSGPVRYDVFLTLVSLSSQKDIILLFLCSEPRLVYQIIESLSI